MKTDNWKLIT